MSLNPTFVEMEEDLRGSSFRSLSNGVPIKN